MMVEDRRRDENQSNKGRKKVERYERSLCVGAEWRSCLPYWKSLPEVFALII